MKSRFALFRRGAIIYCQDSTTGQQTSHCQPYDIPVLVAAGLLKPLGKPQPNSVKYFATADILDFGADCAWLTKMTNAVSSHWKSANMINNSNQYYQSTLA